MHALAALDTAKRLLQYALLLGLSRAEAVAYLHRTAGLQPAMTELGAHSNGGLARLLRRANPATRHAAPQCGISWRRRTRSTSRTTQSACHCGCVCPAREVPGRSQIVFRRKRE